MLIKLDDAIAKLEELRHCLRGLDGDWPDALYEGIEALRALPVSDGWEDIATVPKVEDQWLLLFGPDGVDVGEYNKYCANWQRVRTAEYDNDGCDITPPTHWRPLPAPPSE